MWYMYICLFGFCLEGNKTIYSLDQLQVEKEAEAKGVPVAQALDIAIPPPRPKRKPNNPYPRKTGSASLPISKPGLNDGKDSPGSANVSLPQVKTSCSINIGILFVVFNTDWCAFVFLFF